MSKKTDFVFRFRFSYEWACEEVKAKRMGAWVARSIFSSIGWEQNADFEAAKNQMQFCKMGEKNPCAPVQTKYYS